MKGAAIVYFFAGVIVLHGRHSADPHLPRKTSSAVESLLSLAKSVPPEFRADVLIDLVEYRIVVDNLSTRSLLDEAFTVAADAQEPVALKRVDSAGPLSGALTSSFSRGMDRIGLRARAARALLIQDRVSAQNLFDRIDTSYGSTYSCQDQLYPDLSQYYKIMKEIADAISDPIQREQFLMVHANRVRSSEEIAPFINVLTSVSLSEQSRSTVAQALAARMAGLSLSGRIFSASSSSAIDAMAKLTAMTDVRTRDVLISQTRTWVLKNVQHGVCAVRAEIIEQSNGSTSRVEPTSPWAYFNQRLLPLSSHRRLLLLDLDQAKTVQAGPAPKMDRHSEQWAMFSRILTILGRDGIDAELSPRWNTEMGKYIDALSKWHGDIPDSEDRQIAYLEKADRLTSALTLFPPPASTLGSERRGLVSISPLRQRAFRLTVDFFASPEATEVYKMRRLVWFTPVRSALSSLREAELSSRCSQSLNPLLRLYGSLVRMLITNGHAYY